MKLILISIFVLLHCFGEAQTKERTLFEKVDEDSTKCFYRMTSKTHFDSIFQEAFFYSYSNDRFLIKGYWLVDSGIVYFSPEIFGVEECKSFYPIVNINSFKESGLYVLEHDIEKQCLNDILFFDFYFVKVEKIVNANLDKIFTLTIFQSDLIQDYEDITEKEKMICYKEFIKNKELFSQIDLVLSLKHGILYLNDYRPNHKQQLLPLASRNK